MKSKFVSNENLCKFLLLWFDGAVNLFFLALALKTRLVLGSFQILMPGGTGFYGLLQRIWWLPLIFVSLMFLRGVYSQRLTFWDESREILISIGSSVLFSLLVIFLQKQPQFSRFIFIGYAVFAAFGHPLLRHYFKLLLARAGLYRKRFIIIGAGEAGCAVAAGLTREKELGVELVGFVDDNKIDLTIPIGENEYPVIGALKNLRKIIVKNKIDSVVIAMPSIGRQKLAKIAAEVQRHTRQLYIVPEMKGISAANSQLHHIFNEQLFLIRVNNNLRSLRNRFIKGLFDVLLSLLLMPVLLPAILLFSVLIKLESPGPIFFGHTRIGRNGRKIKVYKFRSMHKDAQERLKTMLAENEELRKEWEATFKLKNDPRITRVGNILRKTSLDELPQFFNVLNGEMSFVGPRPVVEEEIVNYYKENAKFYQMVKPGITGLWQVSGRSDTSYERRVDLDNWYVLNWSLWLDIMILFKTVRVVLKLDGAY